MNVFHEALQRAVGLPDTEMLLNGKVSDQPIRERLHYNRSQYAAAKASATSWYKKAKYPRFVSSRKGGTDFLNFYADPRNRRMALFDYAGAVERQEPVKTRLYSWEAAVIEEYSPGFFARALANPANQPSDLPQAPLTSASTAITAKPSDADDFLDMQRLGKRLEPAMKRLITDVLESLADWDSLRPTDRELVACVVWAIMTTADEMDIGELMEYEDRLAPYYNYVLATIAELYSEDSGGKDNDARTSDAPKTPESLYAELANIAGLGQKNPLDPSLASRAMEIAGLISSALAENVDDKTVEKLANDILMVLLFDLNSTEAIHLLNDEDVNDLGAAWLSWLAERASSTPPLAAADAVVGARESTLDVVGTLKDLQAKKEAPTLALEALGDSPPEGVGIRVRRDFEQQRKDLRTTLDDLSAQIADCVLNIFEELHPTPAASERADNESLKGKLTKVFAEQLSSALREQFDSLKLLAVQAGTVSSPKPTEGEGDTDESPSSALDGGLVSEQTAGTPGDQAGTDEAPASEDPVAAVAETPPETAQSETAEAEGAHAQPAEENPTPAPETKVPAVTLSAKMDEGQACLQALELDAFIPGNLANKLLNRLVADQQIPYAAQIAYSLEAAELGSEFLPWRIFKAAYYGVNTFDDRETFGKAQRTLNGIALADIADWMDQREGDAVPYLIFAASFQPAVFGGAKSTAHILLGDLDDKLFDTNTNTLIEDTITMAHRDEPMSLAMLRTRGSGDEIVHSRFNRTELERWCEKIFSASRGYAPIRKAQTHSLEHGLFKKVTTVLLEDQRDDASVVSNFVAEYISPEKSEELLFEMLADVNIAQTITRVGLSRFHQKVLTLAELCKDWLADIRTSQSSHAEDYAKKFVTRLERTIAYFAEQASKTSTVGAAAGMSYLAGTLSRLLRVVTGEVDTIPYDMVKGWYYLPRQWMALEGGILQDATSEAVRWLIGHAGTSMETTESFEGALKTGRIHMAEVIRQRLNLMPGNDISAARTKQAFEAQKQEFLIRCVGLESKLETAALSSLLDDTPAQAYMTQLEEARDEVESLEKIEPMHDLQSIVETIEADLKGRTAKLKEVQTQRYIRGVEALRSQVSEDAVPLSWAENIEEALAEDNLPVVQEMLDELDRHLENRESIQPPTIKDLPVVAEFVAKQSGILKGLAGLDMSKAVWSRVTEGGSAFGLDLQKHTPALKKALSALAQLHSSKPSPKVDKPFYDRLADILATVGISMSDGAFTGKLNITQKTTHGFSFTGLKLMSQESHRPFPFFGPRRPDTFWTVIVAYQNWTVENLREQITTIGPQGNSILISTVPVLEAQREAFARYCKESKQTIFLLDPALLLFLESVDNDALGITTPTDKFLWLAAAYTYFNPYVGAAAVQPEPEMRFGRDQEIASLRNMGSGAAIVYGGRQLGKSTILQGVQRSFHDPARHQYAFYEHMDKNLPFSDPASQDALKAASRLVWGSLYDNLSQAGLINEPLRPTEHAEFEAAVRNTLHENKKCQILALMDEIDKVLGIDSAHDFPIFRAIRDLMRSPEIQGRFKVVIGGLANVKRFENSPNYPLTQLGSSVQVTIMPTREASHLVMEPIHAAGYRFESAHVVNAILAATNRHPGLLQILCKKLLESMGKNPRDRVGSTVITETDVQAALKNPEVLDDIRERFEMTLNLDKRYLVIVYAIMNEGLGAQSFSVGEAHELAKIWLPEAFGALSERQFEAFLRELVGLGVLRPLDNAIGRYELRNNSVRKLLSESKKLDIQSNLERAIVDWKATDPLDYHAFDPTDDRPPSPITLRDEKTVTGFEFARDQATNCAPNPANFTTTMIVGSDAQGLSSVAATLPFIYNTEEAVYRGGARVKKYAEHPFDSTRYASADEFSKDLRVMSTKAAKAPQMLIIDVKPQTGIPLLLDMLDAANNEARAPAQPKNPLRIVFLVGPAVYWQWLQAREVTAGREDVQAIIHLARWKSCAISTLLEKLGMVDSTGEVMEVEASTGGWYESMKRITSLRKRRAVANKLRDFGKNFTALDRVDEKDAKRFLEKAGATALGWVIPLVRSLSAGDYVFDSEAIALEVMCMDGMEGIAESEADIFREWLLSMDFLRARSLPGRQRKLMYEVAPEIRHMVSVIDG